MECSTFDNPSIRNQPIEFLCTIGERQPSVFDEEDVLKTFLDLVFKLMIDIDEEIDDEWMNPKAGWKLEDSDEVEDSVLFGKTVVNRLIKALGEDVMLPLLDTIILNTVSNDSDWRFKNAGFMAFSQVGEYLEDVTKVEAMIPIVVENFKHENARVRHASLHCIG